MNALLRGMFPLGPAAGRRVLWRRFFGLAGLALLLAGFGCAKSESDVALDTDANGYLCQKCKAKFYTERKVFADICPGCKSMQLSQVVGFVCPDDGFMTVAARTGGSVACEKCRKTTSGLAIPRESDLKTWGAPKKTKLEVSRG